jgi:hydroxyethylthiazole kinase-like sugar kinase family protein
MNPSLRRLPPMNPSLRRMNPMNPSGFSERQPPWVLDPVACGGTAFRTASARALLLLKPSVVRGNASEVMALAGAKGSKGPRGGIHRRDS